MKIEEIKNAIKNKKKTDIPVALKATIVYTVATLLTKGISIFTMPIFTNLLSVSEMGLVNLYNSWFGLLYPIVTLGVTTGSLSIAMNQYKEDRFKYMSSALTMSSLSTLLFFLMYLVFYDSLENMLELPSILIITLFAGFLTTPAYNMFLAKERFEYKYKSIFWVTIIAVITSSLISVLSVLYFRNNKIINLGIVRILSNNMIMYGVSAVVGIYIIINGKKFFSKETVKFNIQNSLPLVLHTFGKSILDSSDRIMISSIVGINAVGLYGVVYSVSNISLIFWTAINNSLIPYMFDKIDQSTNEEKEMNSVVELLILFYAIISVIITLFGPEIISILATEEYYSAIYLIPPIAAGVFLTALYNIFANVLLFYKKSTAIMVSTLITAVVNVILNWIFIPVFGAPAAAYTTLIAYIILAIMQFIAMNKVRNNRKLFRSKVLMTISITVIISILLVNFLYTNLILRYTVILALLLLLFLNKEKIKKILNTVRQK